jgi:hypothetical protein
MNLSVARHKYVVPFDLIPRKKAKSPKYEDFINALTQEDISSFQT